MSTAIDGALDAHRSRLLDQHLAACESCRAEFDALKQTVSLLQGMPGIEPPDDFLAGVRSRVGKRKGLVITGYVFARPQVRVALAAGVVVMLSVFALQWRPAGPSPEAAATDAGQSGIAVAARSSSAPVREAQVEASEVEHDAFAAADSSDRESIAPAAISPHDETVAGDAWESEGPAAESTPVTGPAKLRQESAAAGRQRKGEGGGRIWSGAAKAPVERPGLRAVPPVQRSEPVAAPLPRPVQSAPAAPEPEPEALMEEASLSAEDAAGAAAKPQPRVTRKTAPSMRAPEPPATDLELRQSVLKKDVVIETAVEIRVAGTTEEDVVRAAGKVLGVEGPSEKATLVSRGKSRRRLWFGPALKTERVEAPLEAVDAASAADDVVTLHVSRPVFLRIPAADYPRLLKELQTLGDVSVPEVDVGGTNRVLLKLMITP